MNIPDYCKILKSPVIKIIFIFVMCVTFLFFYTFGYMNNDKYNVKIVFLLLLLLYLLTHEAADLFSFCFLQLFFFFLHCGLRRV